MIRELVVECDTVRAELSALRLAAGKDSSNSGRPPSTGAATAGRSARSAPTTYSYLTTAAKHGINQIKALTILFDGRP